jgi:5-methylthioadenosine/S-adenosylhomocysteine deaminase
VPVAPRGAVLEDHAVVVRGGRIVAVAPGADAARDYTVETTVELPEHALIPGLVNAHTHAAMSLFKGLADDLPLMEWLEDHIWPAETRFVSDGFVRDGTRLAMAEMIRGGTTCFNDMYFFPDEAARVAVEAGLRAVVGLIVIDFPTVWARDADEYLAKALEVHDHLKGDPLVATAFAPHAPYTVSDGPLERIRVLADELDVPVHIHLHETAGEVERSVTEHGERPLARLERLGLVNTRLAAVHMTQLEAHEIDLVAERGTHVVHCPDSNLKLASGYCPLARLLASGANVALGTDGAASNNDLSLFAEMRTASLLGKGVAGDAAAIPAPVALEMATLGGARALGLDESIGSIEPGKAADLVAVDLSELECQPLYHPISHLVYAVDRHQVSHVWVAGRALLKERELLTLDAQALARSAREWGSRIAASDGS